MGFGREVKDFISGFSTGQKIMAARDDREYKRMRTKVMRDRYSPERLKAEVDLLNAKAEKLRKGPDESVLEGRKLHNDLLKLKIQNEKSLLGGRDMSPAMQYAPVPDQSVQPTQPTQPTTPTGSSDLQQDYQYQPTQYGARGGAIRALNYARGGAVDENDMNPAADIDLPVENSEQAPPQMDQPPQETGALSLEPGGKLNTGQTTTSGYSPQAAHDAALAGLRYVQKELGVTHQGNEPQPQQPQQGVPTQAPTEFSSASRGPRKGSMAAYLSGAGMASPQEVMQLKQMVDPKGKMSESERSFAALGTLYSYYLNRGDVDGAARAAGSLVQAYRAAFNRYSALSQAAAEKGDLTNALRAMLKAHANVPDGLEVSVKAKGGKIEYIAKDVQTGKTTEKKLMAPQELLSWATRGGIQTFDQLITQAAGMRGMKHATAPKAMKVSDAKTLHEQADQAWKDKLGELGGKVATAEGHDLQNVTYHMLAAPQNRLNDMTPNEAVSVAAAIAGTGVDTPVKFDHKKAPGGQMVRVNGVTAFLPQDQYTRLMKLRGERGAIKKAKDDKTKKRAERDKNAPGFMETINKYVSQPKRPEAKRVGIGSATTTTPGPHMSATEDILATVKRLLAEGKTGEAQQLLRKPNIQYEQGIPLPH